MCECVEDCSFSVFVKATVETASNASKKFGRKVFSARTTFGLISFPPLGAMEPGVIGESSTNNTAITTIQSATMSANALIKLSMFRKIHLIKGNDSS